MADEEKKEVSQSVAQMTIAAFEYEKVIVVGMLASLFTILILAFYSIHLGAATLETITFVLSFYKDIGLILVGALANSMQKKPQP